MSDRTDSTEGLSALPAPLAERLREIIRRVRRLQRARGLLAVATTALLSLLAVMGLDAALNVESPALRVFLTFCAAAVTAFVFWKKLLRPLRRRVSPAAVARWLEIQHPEMQERVSTALELSGKETAASAQLMAEVLKGAETDMREVDLARELGPGRLRFWKAGAIASGVVLLTLLAVWPRPVLRLLARAVAPLADFGNAWADRIRLLTDDQVVALGEPVEIRAAVSGKAEKVEVLITSADGAETVETLRPDSQAPVEEGETGYALRVPAVAGSFTARVRAGKAVSEAIHITAAERPAVREMTVVYDFPDYTGLPDETVNPADGALEAVAGTRVTVRALTPAKVTKAEALLAAQPVPEISVSENPAPAGGSVVSWSAVLTPGMETVWRLRAEEAHGLTATTPDFPIRALPDQAPVITLEQPEPKEIELRPTEKLPLVYSVSEDFGLSALTLHVNVPGKGETLIPQPLPERDPGDAKRWNGASVLNLEALNLRDVSEIRVRLGAADTLPAELKGAQTGTSRELLIRIRRDAKSLMEQGFLAQHEELRNAMREARNELSDAKGRMDDKANRLQREERLDDHTLKQIEESAKFAQQANDRLRELAERMKDTAFAKQSEDVKRIAEELAKPAAEQARNIPLTDDKQARSELAERAKQNLEDALKTLEEEQRKLEDDREEVKRLAQLADVAERQRALANAATEAKRQEEAATAASAEAGENDNGDPKEVSPVSEEEQRKWVEEQRRVAQRAREFMERHQNGEAQSMPQQLAESAAKAQQLAESAEALAQRQASALEAAKAPDSSAAAAQQQQQRQEEVTREALELQEQAAEFQQAAQRQIDQNSASQEAAWQAQVNIQNAVKNARDAEQELASSNGRESDKPEPGEQGGGMENAAPPLAAGQVHAGTESSEPAEDSQASLKPEGETGVPGEASTSQPAGEQETAAARADNAGVPETPGARPGSEAHASLQNAAEALKGLSESLSAQAGMVKDHGQSLQQGAEQAGQAAERAGQQGAQPPGMARGAEAARQAAENLARAAETAMNARGVPESARNPRGQAQNRRGGKQENSSRGGANPGGQSGNELQDEAGVRGLPPELARLGLTAADWTKVKSVISGAGSARSERVPEEYRELVKAYFGALARGGEGETTKERK